MLVWQVRWRQVRWWQVRWRQVRWRQVRWRQVRWWREQGRARLRLSRQPGARPVPELCDRANFRSLLKGI